MNKDKIAPLFIEAYNSMGYELLNIGDNDLRLGLNKLQELEKQANFPFISANIFSKKDTTKHIFKPFIILQKGNLKFGIIGLASSPPTTVKDIYVGNPIKYYKKYYSQLKEKCDYVIVLGAFNTNDEYLFIRSDIKADLIIFANQYRYSRYLQTQQGKNISYTDHSGKRIIKITGLVEEKNQTFSNASELHYKYKLNNDRLERYAKATKGQKLEEYYKKQPTFLRVVKRLKKQQLELSEQSENIINPLTYEIIEIELKDIKDEDINTKIQKYRKYIGE